MYCDPMQENSYTPPAETPVPPVPKYDLKKAFGSPLFLTLCLLVSIGAGAALFSGQILIFHIIACIGMWMTYASARSEQPTVEAGGFSLVSGTLKVERIFIWIAVGLCALSAVLLILSTALGTFNNMQIKDIFSMVDPSIVDMMLDPAEADVPAASADLYIKMMEWILSTTVSDLLLILGIFEIVFTVFLVLYNIFCFRYLCGFSKSIAQYAKGETEELAYTTAAPAWALVIGIFYALSIFSSASAMMFISNSCLAVAFIMAFVFSKKYFSAE